MIKMMKTKIEETICDKIEDKINNNLEKYGRAKLQSGMRVGMLRFDQKAWVRSCTIALNTVQIQNYLSVDKGYSFPLKALSQ